VAVDAQIPPGTGRAVTVRRGQVLRVEQVRGGQGVDVNVFRLSDHRQRFSASRTRAMHGVAIGVGDILWSTWPRERPLMTIIADSAGVRHDVTYAACSELEYEFASGVPGHTNCAEIQAETIRGWYLGCEAVHDPLNLWLESGATDDGLWWRAAPSGPGDHVELLAHVGVLVSLNPCGDDLFGSSAFEVAPVLARVRAGTAVERARWLLPSATPLRSQRGRGRQAGGDFRLRADRRYMPRFRRAPLQRHDFQVDLPAQASGRLEALRRRGTFGSSDGEIVRAVLWRWWQDRHARSHVTGYPWK